MAKQISIAVVERGTEVLIGLRPDGVPLAGFWEFPGGKVAPGETSQAAAVRECREETGLDVTIAGEFQPQTHTYEHATVAIRFFRCHIVDDSGSKPAGSFRFVEKSSLSNYRFPDANAQLIQDLAQDISQ